MGSGKSMNFYNVLRVLCVYTILLDCNAVKGMKWKLSKEEDLEFEERLKLLNKPAVTTIRGVNGERYHCVDFYKQLSFDHRLIQNNTFDLDKMKATRVAYNKRDNLLPKNVSVIKLNGEKCPVGTVPIRRITKDDLIKERRASKFRSLVAGENHDAHYAVIRTKDSPERYSGASGNVILYKPVVGGSQYSAARFVIKNGPDSIEVGWRVDPVLYGDSECRMFIRTTIRNTTFFNLRSPGFVMTSNKIPLDIIFRPTSVRGGEIYEIKFQITRDDSGNWVLTYDELDNLKIGYWPVNIFSSDGLTQFASYVEWGGEVFSPNGTPKPPMGSGDFPQGDSELDCQFYQLNLANKNGRFNTATNLELFADSSNYKIIDLGDRGGVIGQIIAFGGPGGQSIM